MKKFCLLTVLVMFPQIVETMYSPALSTIALAFEVSAQVAAQTLSVYFVAFAVGVFFGEELLISMDGAHHYWVVCFAIH